MPRRAIRKYSDDFKKQMVQLIENGKKRSELVREYELTPSALERWIHQFRTTGSFHVNDNLTDEQRELIQLRKQNKQLLMENDILKQAALIMGRK